MNTPSPSPSPSPSPAPSSPTHISSTPKQNSFTHHHHHQSGTPTSPSHALPYPLSPLASSSPSSFLSPFNTSNSLSQSSPAQAPTPTPPPIPLPSFFTLPEVWATLESQNTELVPTFQSKKNTITIGRGKEADVKLPSSLRVISNKHCVISIGRDNEEGGNSPWFPFITDYRWASRYLQYRIYINFIFMQH